MCMLQRIPGANRINDREDMAQSHDTGYTGEALASAYLRGQGYVILERNWKSNHREVDIIAKEGPFLVFVEVKSRSSSIYGEPESFVTKHKQRMLIKAANHFVCSRNIDLEVRFDIISVLFDQKTHRLQHIKDAFYVS